MHLHGNNLILSATDLSAFAACPHLTTLSHGAALGGPKPPKFDDPSAEVLRRRGLEHEARILEELRGQGLAVEEVPEGEGRPRDAARAEATLGAMRRGADMIYQGCLSDGRWMGLPDFLRRVERPSGLGGWSYEVVDAKLAREAKAGAVLQITLYSSLLAGAQRADPEHMHLALGRGGGAERFRYHDFAAYARSVQGRLLSALEAGPEAATYPEPVEHCDVCAWKPVCQARWRSDDHLSLVAGIGRRQWRQMEERGVPTLAALARLPLPVRPALEGVSEASLERVREQARIQLEGREAGEHRYELLTGVGEGFGLARLPEPSPGDLFFDIESDPHALDDGLEYLFGYCEGEHAFTGRWALNRAEERSVFEEFVDMVTGRLERWPGLHVYHYGHYEVVALKRLAGRYGSREAALDRLLRGAVFVDLHRVVTQSLRASVESYSIKKLEPLFGYEREVELRTANSALSHFEAWLALGTSERRASDLLRQIEGYNRDDCLATAGLRDWLEERRAELGKLRRKPVPRPVAPGPDPDEEAQEQLERVAVLMARLTEGVPEDAGERTPEEQARWLLAQMLEWHRRENKSFWWQHFEWLTCTDEELIRDRSALGGLEYVGVVETIKRSHVHRYRFPRQEHGFAAGDRPYDPATWRETGKSPGEVRAVDEARGFIDLKRVANSEVPHPTALIPYDLVSDVPLRESLLRLAESVIEHGLGAAPERAAASLLLARPPAVGQAPGEVLRRPCEDTLAAGRRLALALDSSVLPVQGPPGSGKTYTGARMILDLLRAGKRVGVTSNSHKVIGHLLDEVCAAGRDEHVAVTGVQLNSGPEGCRERAIEKVGRDWRRVLDGFQTGEARLAGGTAWLWARPELAGAVDVLVVDEAGQVSLANALAASPAAGSLVLLGDPRQLEQPTQGVHPPGADASALGHAAGGALTLPGESGLFLDRTYRLHPDVCRFTSEVFYESRLEPVEGGGLERQSVDGPGALRETGLRRVDVEHAGNVNESAEETEEVRSLVHRLLRSGSKWTNREGEVQPLTIADVLVVAPYNAQVGALIEALPAGARVGTVDKFQGQEAPVVIYSLASSSAATAPRGMEFLFSPNRLNVATSRARCLAVLVASPALYVSACRSVRHMRFANGFCRFAELAS